MADEEICSYCGNPMESWHWQGCCEDMSGTIDSRSRQNERLKSIAYDLENAASTLREFVKYNKKEK